MLLYSNIWDLMILVPLFIISIGFHEAAHAYAAHFLGDDTPEQEGRLTINPLVHLDPFGTVFLLIAGFGWGRSVNVRAANLRNPLRDMSLIAAAGPAANFGLGALSLIGMMLAQKLHLPFLGPALWTSARLNFFLMFLNLVPIPPLDGSQVLRAFLPNALGRKFDEFAPYGQIVYLGLVLLPVVSTIFLSALGTATFLTMYRMGQPLGIQEAVLNQGQEPESGPPADSDEHYD